MSDELRQKVFIGGLHSVVQEKVAAECKAAGQMTLGAFIAALEKLPDESEVKINCSSPTAPRSYRGYYDHLAFGAEGTTPITVADLLVMARAAMGVIYQGYKGGDFAMHANTPIWAAEWGDSGERIVDVHFVDGIARIITKPDTD